MAPMADPLPVDAARLKAEFPDLTDEDLQAYVTVTARVLGDAVSRAKKMREVMEQGRRAQEKARSGAPLTAVLQARLIELEQRLNDARSEAAQARLDADHARADAQRERGERLEERARAERLAGEVADIAKKLAELMTAANARLVERRASVPAIAPRRTWRQMLFGTG